MEAKNPREGCAALVLGHYHQRRAGVARIRQTWLPTARIRQPDQASHRRAWHASQKCGWPPPEPAVGVFTIHANLGYVRAERERSSCTEQQSEQQRRWTDPDEAD
jgi:hypothetical protein